MAITAQEATIIVAIIGAVVTYVTFLMEKNSERKIELRKIKENQYIDFLAEIAKSKVSNSANKEKINEELSIKVQTIFLVGNKDVQVKLKNFLSLFTNVSQASKTQEALYGELIQSMKLDLYGKRWWITTKSYNSIDEIKLTVFKD